MEDAGESYAPVRDTIPSYTPPAPPTTPRSRPEPLMDGDEPRRPRGPRSFPWGIALIALLIVVGSAAALYAFADAKVTITPTAKTTNVTGDFTATFNSGDLPYEIVTVEKTVSANVPAESTETANDPAQGSITIYNTQASTQTLIKNTRFESPNGLIFRIQDSVTIPAGSASSPGQVKATVYADTGGDQYNIAPATFTVPGLKGTAAFDKVSGKSTSAFSGGFSGTRPSVSDATRDAQSEKNKVALNEALNKAIADEVPAGYVVIPGATSISTAPAPDTEGEDSTVNVNLKGTATAVAIPNAALAKAIAYRTVGSYAGQPVTIQDVKALKLTPTSQGTPTAEQASYAFSLEGSAVIVYDVDTTKIAGAVAGKNRSGAYSIIQSFPEVSQATLTVRPFWKGSFPSDPANITIATTSPSE
jgi:hypothetical protein